MSWMSYNFHRAWLNLEAYRDVGQSGKVKFIDHNKSKFLNHQLVLEGAAFERGRLAGEYTKDLLERQESELIFKLKEFFPSKILQWALSAFAIEVFWDITKVIDTRHLQEMAGVSLSTSPSYNYLGDPFLRQIAYHGVHEVGQAMIDSGYNVESPMACTAFAARSPDKTWLIGRNFDFEASRTLDEEKIIKWSFPPDLNAYVAVTWAGMVGVVTGINEKGLYLSINAAGSKYFEAIALPSNLLVTKILEEASTIEEALDIFKKTDIPITDIFLLADSKTQRVFLVEKAASQTSLSELRDSTAISNHLRLDLRNDLTNLDRMKRSNTTQRLARGEELIREYANKRITPERLQSWLRDRSGPNNTPYPTGDRRSIDALIATHSIIFDMKNEILFASSGPSLVGEYEGYQLRESFRLRQPVLARRLPKDPFIDEVAYRRLQENRDLDRKEAN